ncbi:MAG: Polysaccharide deacetylase [Candidatus Gottesmanbacteria bacterium GW2011_GWC2_39_8]|uniref:Polysaccharide deacetylase n=1 Tax=Candidatus Gottesmanbacteria bacterium GW2011_GWC2_39_8 TaxID=1618450 RepID=A0A0G0PYM6_9BACT|nr:MAG: Polysaccharide deacetylase [Candidatus Gottesmanbacteria bacterium GW2011_GWC2_39_8]
MRYKKLKDVCSIIFCSTIGRSLGWLRRNISPYSPIILVYHSVCPVPCNFFKGLDNVTPDLFERQMIFFKQNYNVCSLEELLSCIREKNMKKNMLSVTFDDGFKNNIEFAYTILLRWKIPATIFLVSDLMDNKTLFWRNKLAYIFNSGLKSKFFDFLPKNHPGKLCNSLTNCKLRHRDILTAIDLVFKQENINERELAQSNRFYIGPDDIESIDSSIISFGCHTRTHPVLSELSRDEQRDEILGSYEKISKILDDECLPFAYPFGTKYDFNEDSKQLAIEAGCTSILKCEGTPRQNNMESSTYGLNRIAPSTIPPYMLTSFLEGTTLSGVQYLINNILSCFY